MVTDEKIRKGLCLQAPCPGDGLSNGKSFDEMSEPSLQILLCHRLLLTLEESFISS